MANKQQKPGDALVNQRGGRYRPSTVYETTVNERGEIVQLGADGEPMRDGAGELVVLHVPDCPVTFEEYEHESNDTKALRMKSCEKATKAWRSFWLSPVSQLAQMDSHGPALEHWIRLIEQRAYLWHQYVTAPLVLGSKRQPMANPIWRQVREIDDEIAHYEETFGMTPLAQMRLGVEFLTGQALTQSLRGNTPQGRRAPSMIESGESE